MIISNSETDTYLACKRRHYYRFGLGLSPKTMSRALHIGLLGHSILETYYKTLMDGYSKDQAIEAGMQEVLESFDYEDPDVVSIISNRFLLYTRHYDDSVFRVLDVEGVYKIPLNQRITLGMTVDLLVEFTKGPYRGQLVVIDHKYKYNFPSPDELSMNVQLYKYIWGLRQLDYPVTFAIMNVLRYREDIKDVSKLFARFELRPQGDQLKNIMVEHVGVSEEIFQAKSEPVAVYGTHAHRRGNDRDCSGCSYRRPCRLSLIGKDETLTLATMFTPDGRNGPYKPYGY